MPSKRSVWHSIDWSNIRNLKPANAVPPDLAASPANRLLALPTVHTKTPEEEACVLLQAAAEVEHALLVEYLFALWSLGPTPSTVQRALRTVAIQEMGHLITVQNLLLFLGAEPYFQRQDASPQPALDPFPFALESLSVATLERYIAAEMPLEEHVPADWRAAVAQILERNAASGVRVNRVGAIYAMLYWLFQAGDEPEGPWAGHKQLADFPAGRHIASFPGDPARSERQASRDEPAWREQYGHGMVFLTVNSREEALAALAAVSAQGEGPGAGNDSHFERFFLAHQTATPFPATLNLPRNPYTGVGPDPDPEREASRVTQPLAAALCDLFDARYRIMLTSLKAALARGRSDTLRETYIRWALEEMTAALRKLPARIMKLPCKPEIPDGARAAPGFRIDDLELPDTPDELSDLLRELHTQAATAMTTAAAAQPDVATNLILNEIRKLDDGRRAAVFDKNEGDPPMPKIYRIHPAIGIARLGGSQSDFFLAPEVPGLGPIELTDDATLQPVDRYKDNKHLIRRQAVRFRVFEVTLDAAGAEQSSREITVDDADIVWSVELGNEKAAAGRFVSETQPESNTARNPGVAQAELIIKPVFPTISGSEKTAVATTPGRFKGADVYLGELRTDKKGRLIVLGGRGESGSMPANKPLGGGVAEPGHPRNDFANNECWHDDTADGPISATVTFAGQAPVKAESAWVIVSPPDYSPHTRGLTTLHDIALQAAVDNNAITLPAKPSFKAHILPILRAASNLRWVDTQETWEAISRDHQALARADAASAALRIETFELLMSIEGGTLLNFHFTDTQRRWLMAWSDGDFVEDFTSVDPPPAVTATGLDRASLEQGVGGGFFPGIEAGIRMTFKEMYVTAFRLRTDAFTIDGVPQQPRAGWITRNMACPWQADFLKCASESTGTWWPAQRPIDVLIESPNGPRRVQWVQGIGNHKDLVARHQLLGFVQRVQVAGNEVLIERERDDNLPR